MAFIARVNDDLLYRSPDGREGFVIFGGDGMAHFGPDITAKGFERTVGYTADALREIAFRLDQRSGEVS